MKCDMQHFKTGMANGMTTVLAALAALSMAAWSQSSCNSKVGFTADGTATVRHVVTIEFGVCDSLPEIEAKVECVSSLLDILKEAAAEAASGK